MKQAMQRKFRGLITGLWVVVVMVCLLGSSGAMADELSETPLTTSPIDSTELNANDIPSEKVDQFVSAYLTVVGLIDDRVEELQRAETETESRRLQEEIEAEAFQLIEAANLTREDYFQLLGLANTDPEFRDRVLAQLEERDE